MANQTICSEFDKESDGILFREKSTARVKFKLKTKSFVIGVCKRRFETATAMMEM